MFSNARQLLAATVAGVALVAAGAVPAHAQSNDQIVTELQRRQIELERQLQELRRQQEELLGQLERVTTAGAGDDVSEAPRVTRSGQERVKLSVSGQVNRGVLIYDDGDASDVVFVDNDNSSSRVRFVGSADVTDDISIGTNIEVEFESGESSAVTQGNQAQNFDFAERKIEAIFTSRTFGRLSIGQGDTASNGTSEVDLSGTDVIGYSSIADMAGGVRFRRSDTGTLPGVAIGDAFNNFDGDSRDDRIRYDSPRFAGVQLSGSVIRDGNWDIAGRYAQEFGDFKVGAAIGYVAFGNSASVRDQIGGSFSVLHGTGINVTFAAGSQDLEGNNDDPFTFYVKGGYIADFFSIGSTAFAIDYTETEDLARNDDEATSIGGFIVQDLEDFGTEFYFGVRNHALDRTAVDYEDILAVLTGARVRF